MLGFDQVVAVSLDDARDELLEILEDVGFPAGSWQVNSIPWGLVTIGALIWSKGTEYAVELKESGFSETAKGTALTRLAQSNYLNTRRKAAPEIHLVTLACAAGEGPHTIDVGGFSAKNSNGYVFTNVADTITQGGALYPKSYPVNLASGRTIQLLLAAETEGEAAFTEPGELSTIVTTLSGVTLTANERLINGRDLESNESLRKRNSLKWALLSFGLMDDTIEALAREAAPSLDRIFIQSTNPRGPGTVNVYITSTQGNVGSEEKLAAYTAIHRRIMHDPDERSITEKLLDPIDGTALLLTDAPTEDLDFVADVYLRPGFNWARDVLPAIETKLEAWRRTIPLGGFAYPEPGKIVAINEIEHVIRGTKLGTLEPVLAVKLQSPTDDVRVADYTHMTRGTWTLNPIVVENEEEDEGDA
jgi:hypothetical protein